MSYTPGWPPKPSAPDNYVVGLGRRILVQLGKSLCGDDPGISSFAILAHQTDDSLGRFGIARACCMLRNLSPALDPGLLRETWARRTALVAAI